MSLSYENPDQLEAVEHTTCRLCDTEFSPTSHGSVLMPCVHAFCRQCLKDNESLLTPDGKR